MSEHLGAVQPTDEARAAYVAVFGPLIDWLNDNADRLDGLIARLNEYQRHHPQPMPPGMVTWPTRRRRHRRAAR